MRAPPRAQSGLSNHSFPECHLYLPEEVTPPPRIVFFFFGRLWSTLDSERVREGGRERGKEECGLWEGKEVGVNVRKEKHSQFL